MLNLPVLVVFDECSFDDCRSVDPKFNEFVSPRADS